MNIIEDVRDYVNTEPALDPEPDTGPVFIDIAILSADWLEHAAECFYCGDEALCRVQFTGAVTEVTRIRNVCPTDLKAWQRLPHDDLRRRIPVKVGR